MAIQYTPQQQKVIDLKNRNILVSAAAGSGKTAVLVERIVTMVCDEECPVDIDRLLIVTFTNAAAAEMRERISLGIADRLAAHPDSEHIQKQSTLLHNAQITTIDSFCMFLIRNHFNEIGLDPAFRVADEGEIKLLKHDVLTELMEEKFGEREEAFRYCVEYFCPGGKEKVLEQYILDFHQYAESHPWPEDWLLARKSDYGKQGPEEIPDEFPEENLHENPEQNPQENLEQNPQEYPEENKQEDPDISAVASDMILGVDVEEYLRKHLKDMLAGCHESMVYAQSLCQEPDGPYMYGELIDKELEMLEGLCGLPTLEEYAVKLPAVVFGRLPSRKDDSVSPVKRELARNIRQQVKDTIGDIAERFFATPLPLAAKQAAACREPVSMFMDLVMEFGRRLQEKKQEKRILDYADMEHYALNILLEKRDGKIIASQVAREYRQHFQEILIDEYQDSNLVQEYLLKAISGEEDGRYNRFMVGDVKQSIYKFRQARPELFLEKYDDYTQEDSCCQRIDLTKNFRSRGTVVDTVNGVFSRIMSRKMGGIDYDEKAALYPAASYPHNPDCGSELLLVEKQEKHSDLNARQAEALAIALRIKELRQQFQVTDKETGQLRPVRYGDMVILLRTNSGWDEEFKQILEEEGIPVHITSKTGYFEASEVQELLQFLRVLDNPEQDIPLYGVMKSLFGRFTEEEIALLRSREWMNNLPWKMSLYDAVLNCAREAEMEEEHSKVEVHSKIVEQSKIEGHSKEEEHPKEEVHTKEEVHSKEVEHSKEEKLPELRAAEWIDRQPVSQHPLTVPTVLAEKCKKFIETINRYRSRTVYMPIRELLQEIVKDFDYLPYVSALPAGSKRRANVEMLFTKASDFEKTSYFGLFHFVRYIEQLEKYDQDYGEAELLDENADVVRIMSIHKSKGLEFPVVFIAGLSKRFNMQDLNRSLIVDMDLGLGCDYVNPEKRIRNKTLRRSVIVRKMREDNLAEELRVLYVAMTRAKEKMILTGTKENAAQVMEKTYLNFTFPVFMAAGTCLDFLLPVIRQTSVEVRIMDVGELAASRTREQVHLYERREMLKRAREHMEAGALKQLEESFACRYPWKALEKLYTKTTVSELKLAAMAGKDEAAYHAFEEKEVVPYIPAFRRGREKVSGTVRGNAYHRVMELMDFSMVYQEVFSSIPDTWEEFHARMDMECSSSLEKEHSGKTLADSLHKFLDREKGEGRLVQEYFDAVNLVKLRHFLMSDIAFRMWRADAAGNLFREQPFVYGINAGRLGDEFPEGEKVLIQGIIDVFFIEEGHLVLLDYKTDVIHTPGELWDRYEVQLQYYKEALCRLTGLPMKEKLLYSFYLEQCVKG